MGASCSVLWTDEAMHDVATKLSIGVPIPGWHRDSRGIVSHCAPEAVFRDPAVLSRLLFHGFEPGGSSVDMYTSNRVVEPERVKVQRRALRRLAGERKTFRRAC